MLKGASLLVSLQLLSRLITFLANQFLLRYLTASLLGISAQLEVYYLSVLFFARESLRVAIQRQGIPAVAANPGATRRGGERQGDNVSRESQAVVNLGYLAIILGLAVSMGLGWLYLSYTTASTTIGSTPYLVTSLYIYGLASMLELLSEPCFVLMQTRLQFGTRATAESLATFCRCGVVFTTAVWASRGGLGIGVLPFALGQVTYGAVLLLVYIVSGHRLASTLSFSLLPKPVSPSVDFIWSLFYRPTITLASSMMAQSLVKHVLTQGDTFLVSLLSTPDVQGVYALANNYGGLLARLLFQPVEESSRSYFSRLLSASSSNTAASASSATPPTAAATNPQSAVTQAKKNLHTLLRLYALLSVCIVTFGPVASQPLLSLVAGPRWSSAAAPVLALYCLYIPLLALNGLTEAFVASVATEKQVHTQSAYMSLFSFVFAVSAWLFMSKLGWGAGGLVAANAVNMSCRILWSVRFVSQWFAERGLQFQAVTAVPWTALGTGVGTALMMHQVNMVKDGENPFITLAKIAGTAAPFVLLVFVTSSQRQNRHEYFRLTAFCSAILERKFFQDCISPILSRNTAR